jgi:hypothetical protein
MSAEAVTSALLAAAPPLVLLVGDRRAASMLPEGSALPAVVYHTISAVPDDRVADAAVKRWECRVQIDIYSLTIPQLKQVLSATIVAMRVPTPTIVGGYSVIYSGIKFLAPVEHHQEPNLWRQSADFRLIFSD